MFYLGGMTLGYFTPPAAKSETNAAAATSRSAKQTVSDEQERDRELARAFLTPWHLFY